MYRQHRIYRDKEKAHPSLKLNTQKYVHFSSAGRTESSRQGFPVSQIQIRQCEHDTCNVNREQTLIEVNLTDADEENADFTHFFAEFSLSRVFTDFDMFNKISEDLRSDL